MDHSIVHYTLTILCWVEQQILVLVSSLAIIASSAVRTQRAIGILRLSSALFVKVFELGSFAANHLTVRAGYRRLAELRA